MMRSYGDNLYLLHELSPQGLALVLMGNAVAASSGAHQNPAQYGHGNYYFVGVPEELKELCKPDFTLPICDDIASWDTDVNFSISKSHIEEIKTWLDARPKMKKIILRRSR